MADSFQQGIASGSAVFAPFVQATQNAQAYQVAQADNAARQLFQQNQLNTELGARAKLAKAEQLFRAKQVADQLAAAAQEAAINRTFQTQLADERYARELQAIADANARTDALAQERRANTTKVASGLFGQISQAKDELKNAVKPTEQDMEQALASSMLGMEVKRATVGGKPEDFASYYSRVLKEHPEVAGLFSAELQKIQTFKASSPDVLALTDKVQTFGNIFQNVLRTGDVDPSFLDSINAPQARNADPNDMAGRGELLSLLANMQPGLDKAKSLRSGGVSVPNPSGAGGLQASEGLVATVPKAVAQGAVATAQGADALANALAGIPGALGQSLFGAPAVSEADLMDTKKYAETFGVSSQQFDALDDSQKRYLNQKRIRSNAAKKVQQSPALQNPFMQTTPGIEGVIPF